jgi:hypothetical protein
MSEEKVTKLLRRFEVMKEIRRRFEPMWKEVMWHISPVMFDFDEEKRDKPYEIPKRITNKPANFLNTLVAGICGYAVSPNIKWFKLGLANDFTMRQVGVRQWLEQVEIILLRTFERCGFYTKVPQWIEQSATFGQAAMLIEELHNSDKPLRYTVPEVYELYLGEDGNGDVTDIARNYYVPIESLIDHYGEKKMHERVLDQWERIKETNNVHPDLDVKIIHLVTRRRNGRGNNDDLKQNKKWASYIIDEKNKHIIQESGYDEFPYCLFFWEQRGKVYGISPAIKAINDIALLQETEKTRLNVAEQSANPAKIVPESMKGREQFQPGGYNYIRNPDMVPSQLDVGANYPITIQITDAMAAQVKEWFAVDTFTALRQMDGLQNATATAVSAMQGEQTALLTPMVTNLYQGLSPVIERTFNILAKKKLLPPMPFVLQQMGGSLKPDFLGILAQAQKAAYEFGGIADVLAVAGQFAQFGQTMPEFAKAVYWLRPDVVFKKTIESRSAPADIMRNEEEYEEMIAQVDQNQAQAQQQAQQAQLQQAVLQNSGKLNEPLMPDSPLAQFTSALGNGVRKQ